MRISTPSGIPCAAPGGRSFARRHATRVMLAAALGGASVLASASAVVITPTPTGFQTAASGSFDERWAAVRALYRAGVDAHGIVGSSLLLMKEGRVIGRAVEGLMDLEAKRPVDEDTIFHWASITKTATGIAIMQLRDRGLLALDDPAVKYVPELRAVHNPYGDMSQVTIRHLMTHSGGFRAGTWPWGGDEPWHPFEPQRWEQLVAMFPYTQVQFPPGSRFSYSNPGIVFLGRIIEQLAGEDYEVYVDKNVFRPLQMTRTYFDTAPVHLRDALSHSWYRTGSQLRPGRFDADTGITVSNSGMNAPFGDMAKYLAFLMGDPARQAEYDRVLKRSSLEEMFRPQVKIEDPQEPTQRAIGLIFFLEEVQGRSLVAHSGDQNGFISHFFLDMPSRTGYVVNFNTYARPGTSPGPQDTKAFDRELRDRMVALF